MQMIPYPDMVWIRESYQKQCECIRIQIPESGFQEFLCWPQIRIGSVPYGTVPLLRIQVGCKHFLCKGTYHLGHLVEARDAISRVIPGPWYYCVGPEPPKPPELCFSYHFYGNLLNSYSLDGHPLQPGPWVWGVPPECLDAWLDHWMQISQRFSNVR